MITAVPEPVLFEFPAPAPAPDPGSGSWLRLLAPAPEKVGYYSNSNCYLFKYKIK